MMDGERYWGMLFSLYDALSVLMNSQPLWLCTQDPHKIKRVKIPAREKKELLRFTPTKELVILIAIIGKRDSIFLFVCSH